MKKANPKAILFDLDGVIVDSEAIHHRAYELALKPFGVERIPFEDYALYFSNRGEGLDYVVGHYGVDGPTLKHEKEKLFLDLLRREAELRPGITNALRGLAERWPLALATGSGSDAASFVLDRFHLRDRFRVIVAREDYMREKPAPDAFLKASSRLGVSPLECVVIEDSYKGLCAATAARMRCVVVPNDYTRGGDFSEASAVLSSMDELTAPFVENLFFTVS